MTSKNVLFPILNWGLGHASRSLPIIRQVMARGHRVTIASDGQAAHLLKRELPQLDHVELPNYGATYSAKYFFVQHLRLAARTAKAIHAEQQTVKRLMNSQSFDVIISDNRYGAFHSKAVNVILTHQLNIPLPSILQKIVSGQIRRYVQKFDFCWIPDLPNKESISGQMSAGSLKIPKRYIGPQSRFDLLNEELIYELAVVLSGPEPQRSLLQQEVLDQLQTLKISAVVVLGVSDATRLQTKFDAQIEVHDMLTSGDLNRKLCQSKKVLSRSGYSTLMDLTKLGKPAILIPTPGQPEQNYLAKLHNKNPLFQFQKQTKVNIANGIDALDKVSRQNKWSRSIASTIQLEVALTEIGL